MTKADEGRDTGGRDWEQLYGNEPVESLPWYYPELDPDFQRELENRDVHQGEALDLCTGPGTQAVALAARGLTVTATDIAENALVKAGQRARQAGLHINFRQNNILDNHLDTKFDFVIDRGCYHVFPVEDRKKYVRAVAGLLRPGGILLLKCFSNRPKGNLGPYRIHPEEIDEFFRPSFAVLSIKHTVFPGRKPEPEALFCVLRKRD